VTPRAVPTLTYHELVAELFPRLTGGIRWGLERTQRILAGAGDPHRRYGVLHVGGTNGKGSVAAHIEAVLRAQGHRTGLYTSPHLCTFRERIRIGGRAVGEAELLAAAGRVWPAIVAEGASFFEATTAIAFVALADAEVDVAIVEVGLGGRLDATNVVDPDVVVLTNVSLDHIQLLGNTLPAVAREKAGIIKPGVPVVTAEPDGAALAVFRATAAAAAARLVELDAAAVADVELSSTATRFTLHGTGWGDVRLATPLAGAHQVVNAALAALALDATPRWRPDRDSLVAGLAATRWPGRLQLERVAGVMWAFDVAHNVAGVQALVAALHTLALPRPLCTVAGVLGDKDWADMLAPLHAASDRVLLTSPPTAPADRRWDPARALAAAPSPAAEIVMPFEVALGRAHALARDAGGTVLVTGSFHTVGDALTALGLCPEGSDASVPAPAFMR
jgi:dihydrofolate synthase / folylpolyglutamate synthase